MRFYQYFSSCLLALGLTLVSVDSTAATITTLDDTVVSTIDDFSIGQGDVVSIGANNPNWNPITSTGYFSEYYSFILEDVGTSIVTSLSITGISSSDYLVSVFDSNGSNDADDWSFISSVGTGILTLSGLSSGITYFVQVSGEVFKTPASYDGTIAAVPLPAAAVLFGSALLGFVGFATRRRVS